MKNMLRKLANGINEFECVIFGQERKCEILQIKIYNLEENRGKVFVRVQEPIKKIIRREVEDDGNCLGFDNNYTQMEDVEVESYEEWIDVI